VNLFSKSTRTAETLSFFDSVCGIELFRLGKQGRSIAEFEKETREHGWPSFRTQDIVGENVLVKDGQVVSKCGTFLGTMDSDNKGPRYCLDLSCIAGSPLSSSGSDDNVVLVSFGTESSTTKSMETVDDPVMGGQSSSTFSVVDSQGVWSGAVNIVPFLQKPGFCTLRTSTLEFPNLDGSTGLVITATNSKTSKLNVFEAQIMTSGGRHGLKHGTYIANFSIPADGEERSVFVPWKSFHLSWRGQSIPGPNIKSQLDKVIRVGLGTHGIAGSFRVDISSISSAASESLYHLSRSSSSTLGLLSFDGAKSTTFPFHVVNDPVMGGLSYSTFKVHKGAGIFNGTVAIVPKLKAPGFCNAETNLLTLKKFNDLSTATHLVLKVRTKTPEYKGFKFSFAADTINPQFWSYKTNFEVPGSWPQWSQVVIPWNRFSNDWSAFTGDCDSPPHPRERKHKCCTPVTPEVCPTPKNLKHISQLGFWAEGHAGDFHLEIQSVYGVNDLTFTELDVQLF